VSEVSLLRTRVAWYSVALAVRPDERNREQEHALLQGLDAVQEVWLEQTTRPAGRSVVCSPVLSGRWPLETQYADPPRGPMLPHLRASFEGRKDQPQARVLNQDPGIAVAPLSRRLLLQGGDLLGQIEGEDGHR
jgi:hypothetical protein